MPRTVEKGQKAALGMVATVVVVALVALGGRLFLVPRLHRQAASIIEADYGRQDDPVRLRQLKAAITDAKLTDHSGQLVMWGYVPLGIAAAAVTVLALKGYGPLDLVPAGS